MAHSPKKVVIIGPAYPLRGGLAAFNQRMAEAYQQQGDEAIIYSFSLQYPSIFFPGTTQYSDEPPPEGIDIRVKINSVNPFNWIKTAREIAKLNPDLVVVRFWMPFMAPCLGTISRILRRKSKAKVIAITDNIIPHEKRFFDYPFVKYFTGSVDGFIAMSGAVLNDISKFNKQKPRKYQPHPLYDSFGDVVPKAEALKKLGLSENMRYLLFFGFIRDYKGLDLLLEAIDNKDLRNMDLRLIVAGEFYDNEEKYMNIINSRQLNDRVVLRTQFIPNAEIALYFSACDIVVQPYRNATQSGVTQIAYHFGKPVITTNVGGLSEMIKDGKVGYVVDPLPEEIAEAILKFYNEQKEAEFIENVKIEKLRFSWEGLLDSIDEIAFQKQTRG